MAYIRNKTYKSFVIYRLQTKPIIETDVLIDSIDIKKLLH